MTGGPAHQNRRQLPIAPAAPPASGSSDSIQGLLGIEEYTSHYPPRMKPLGDPREVFEGPSASPKGRAIDIFVDFPYCTTICGFCPFNVHPYHASEVESYLAALAQEVREIKALVDFGQIRVRTVWIGAGTTSTLDEVALEKLLEIIARNFDLAPTCEYTVEIKPDLSDLAHAKFDIMRNYGVTRVSMGVQSTGEDELRLLGRGHTADEAFRVIEMVKDAGFPLNIDMMYRLPGQELAEVERDLDAVRGRGIDHMSWYPYIAQPGTSLANRIDRGRVRQQVGRVEYFAMFKAVHDFLGEAGYEHYTPNHFSLNGRCEYYVDHWQMPQLETLGIGPGAFSFFNGWIYRNERDPAKYAQLVADRLPPVTMATKLTAAERKVRLAYYGFRLFSIDMETFREHADVPMEQYYEQELDFLVRAGLVEVRDGRIECTLAGKAFNGDIGTVLSTDMVQRITDPRAIDLVRI